MSIRPSRSLSGAALPKLLTASFALVAALCLALAGPVTTAIPAAAHAEVLRITPARDAHLANAPRSVVLEFNEPVSTSFATVVVTTAAGLNVSSGKAKVVGMKVTQPLTAELASGHYQIVFRVVSDDGHPVTGGSDFTLSQTATTAPPEPTSATTPAETPAVAPAPTSAPSSASAQASAAGVAGPALAGSSVDDEGGAPSYILAIAGIGLLVIGAGVLLWRRERR